MLIHQNRITAVPGDPDFPIPSSYLQFTDELIEKYGSTDFRWSWQTYDKETFLSVRRVWWGKEHGSKSSWYALPEVVWDFFARTIWDDLLEIVSKDVDTDESPSGSRRKMEDRMERVNRYRTALKWLQLIDRQAKPSSQVPDERLISIDANPDFICFLIKQVELAMPISWDEHRFLTPSDEIALINAINALKVQLPSKHPQYLVPSQLMPLEKYEIEAIQNRWAYMLQELQQQQKTKPPSSSERFGI